jgi:hypothetical protein
MVMWISILPPGNHSGLGFMSTPYTDHLTRPFLSVFLRVPSQSPSP